MNREDLYQSFNKIDDDILERSETSVKKKSSTWVKWGTMAACLCLVVGGIVWGTKTLSPKEEPSGYVVSEEGITIPPMEVALSKDAAAMSDMIGFFIYEGRCYVYYENFSEAVFKFYNKNLINFVKTLESKKQKWYNLDNF